MYAAILIPAQALIVLRTVEAWFAPLGTSRAWANHVASMAAGAYVHGEPCHVNVAKVHRAMLAAGVEADCPAIAGTKMVELVDAIAVAINAEGAHDALPFGGFITAEQFLAEFDA